MKIEFECPDIETAKWLKQHIQTAINYSLKNSHYTSSQIILLKNLSATLRNAIKGVSK